MAPRSTMAPTEVNKTQKSKKATRPSVHLVTKSTHKTERNHGSSLRSTAEEAVRIIAAAVKGKAYGRKQGIPCKYLFPYDLVERGDEGKAIKKGEACSQRPGFPRPANRCPRIKVIHLP